MFDYITLDDIYVMIILHYVCSSDEFLIEQG